MSIRSKSLLQKTRGSGILSRTMYDLKLFIMGHSFKCSSSYPRVFVQREKDLPSGKFRDTEHLIRVDPRLTKRLRPSLSSVNSPGRKS